MSGPSDNAARKKSRAPEPTPDRGGDQAAGARRFQGRANVVVSSVLVVLITLMANYLSFRHYHRWDWTSEGLFTLSPRTHELLTSLDTDIDVYLVLSSGESNYQDVRELLERYRAESQHVVLHFVDPDREPSEYQLIAERFGLARAMLADGSAAADVAVVMSNGDRVWKITRDDLVSVDFDPSGEGDAHVDVRSEQAISGGLLEVTSGRATHVCITTGHGEWTLDHGVDRDLGGFRDEMRRENLEIEQIETRGRTALPENCDATFVVGPIAAFTPEEAAMLRRYAEGGGHLFLALDPELDGGEIRPTGLEAMLRELGIRVDRTVVLEMDERHLLPSQPSPTGPFLVASYGEHPITSSFAALDLPMVVNLVRSVRPADESEAVTIMSASDASFAETDVALLVQTGEPRRDDQDYPGPVSLAVALELPPAHGEGEAEDDDASAERRGRIVVVGDADFLSSQLIATRDVINYELASAILGWLTARQALIEVAPRRMTTHPVQLTDADVVSLGFRVIVLLPLASVFLGIAIWWQRRS
ncbi:MAG: GldG family protein [Sandaracinus sp.]